MKYCMKPTTELRRRWLYCLVHVGLLIFAWWMHNVGGGSQSFSLYVIGLLSSAMVELNRTEVRDNLASVRDIWKDVLRPVTLLAGGLSIFLPLVPFVLYCSVVAFGILTTPSIEKSSANGDDTL